jgi:hypothetical protein
MNIFDQFNGLLPGQETCYPLNGDEHFFDAIADAFSPELLSTHNAGFLRPDAYLAVVMVNWDPLEDDGFGWDNETTLGEATAIVHSLKIDPSLASVSYIFSTCGGPCANEGVNIGRLVENTGGVELNTDSLTGWPDSLLDVLSGTTGLGVFALSEANPDPSMIQVAVGGVPTSDWSYDSVRNAVAFTPGKLPPPGSTVTITYPFGCP